MLALAKIMRWAKLATAAVAAMAPAAAYARSPETDARGAMSAFANNCFSPFLTTAKAERAFGLTNLRYDFYDLEPFSDTEPSPAKGDVAADTDRRCEVSFSGDYAARAAETAIAALSQEGILTEAPLPSTYKAAHTSGTALLAARQLNPQRVAVVHVGTRPGPDGVETFMNVERLRPQK